MSFDSLNGGNIGEKTKMLAQKIKSNLIKFFLIHRPKYYIYFCSQSLFVYPVCVYVCFIFPGHPVKMYVCVCVWVCRNYLSRHPVGV